MDYEQTIAEMQAEGCRENQLDMCFLKSAFPSRERERERAKLATSFFIDRFVPTPFLPPSPIQQQQPFHKCISASAERIPPNCMQNDEYLFLNTVAVEARLNYEKYMV